MRKKESTGCTEAEGPAGGAAVDKSRVRQTQNTSQLHSKMWLGLLRASRAERISDDIEIQVVTGLTWLAQLLAWRTSWNTKYVGFISRIHLLTSPKVIEQTFCLSHSFEADQSDFLPVEPGSNISRLPTGASRYAPHCLTKLLEKPARSEAKTCCPSQLYTDLLVFIISYEQK